MKKSQNRQENFNMAEWDNFMTILTSSVEKVPYFNHDMRENWIDDIRIFSEERKKNGDHFNQNIWREYREFEKIFFYLLTRTTVMNTRVAEYNQLYDKFLIQVRLWSISSRYM